MNTTNISVRVGFTSLLTAFALVAGACGDDGTRAADGVADSTPASTTTTTAATPTTTDPGGAVELTATDTGVTESLIRVGAVFPDTSLIGRDPGDIEAKFRTVADDINDRGGINGRTIELHFRAANPLDDADFEAVCVELTADREVFAAIGLFPRTTPDCYAALNDTIVINAFGITAEQMDRYTAPGITMVGHASRLLEARIDALLDGGVIAEGTKIALHGAEQAREAHELYLAALDAAGVDVVVDTVGLQTGEDLTALESEMQTFTQVWEASGAEAVMASTALASQAILIGYNNAGIELPFLLPEGTGVPPSLLQDQLGLDLAPFELATALVEGDDPATKYETGEDGVRECVDRFEAATGEQVALDESRDNLAVTIVACQVFDVFTQVAEAAGPDLTTESFAAAADEFGPIEVTDLAAASLGPGKWDLDDTVGVVARFNPDAVRFEPVG